MTRTTAEREVFSPEELAAFLGCGRTYAFQLLREEAIPSFKLGRLRKVRREDAEQYIQRQLAAGSTR
jgi:excisionase family DNA binding protein